MIAASSISEGISLKKEGKALVQISLSHYPMPRSAISCQLKIDEPLSGVYQKVECSRGGTGLGRAETKTSYRSLQCRLILKTSLSS